MPPTRQCTDRNADGSAVAEIDPPLAAFGTPGERARLEIVTGTGERAPFVDAVAVVGGVVVLVQPDSLNDPHAGPPSLTFVDHDGRIVWRRCLTAGDWHGLRAADLDLDPTIVWWTSSTDGTLTTIGLSVADGSLVTSPVVDRFPATRTDRFALFPVDRQGDVVGSDDTLIVVDLVDGTMDEILYPPAAAGRQWFDVTIGLLDRTAPDGTESDGTESDGTESEGEFVLFLQSMPAAGGPPRVEQILVGNAWADASADNLPERREVFRAADQSGTLAVYDVGGDLLWSVADVHHPGREGFDSLITDDVVLAIGCLEWDIDARRCGLGDSSEFDIELIAFDAATGTRLWSRDGVVDVPVVDGSVGIVVTGDDARLTDLRTGEPVGDSTWPVDAFANRCCGDGEYVFVTRSGALILAHDFGRLRVWYPESSTPAETIVVDMLG